MKPGMAGALLALIVLAAGCAEERAAAPLLAPVTPRAAWLLEPAQIGVGQLTTLELAVATPPGWTLAPWEPPPAPPGLALLASETLPVEQEDTRWIHRTRLRLRAMATGARSWPAGALDVEAPDGTRATLELPEHPIEVVSILPEYPDRVTPFGARSAASAEAPPGPVWAPALLGAATALAVVALVALARHRRRIDSAANATLEAVAAAPAWEQARDALDAVRARAGREPFAAAHGLSLALRRFVDRRFGAATSRRSGEELRAEEAPFAARSRWPALLAILADLDGLRFRSEADSEAREALAARIEDLIDAGARFVEDAVPPDARG